MFKKLKEIKEKMSLKMMTAMAAGTSGDNRYCLCNVCGIYSDTCYRLVQGQLEQ